MYADRLNFQCFIKYLPVHNNAAYKKSSKFNQGDPHLIAELNSVSVISSEESFLRKVFIVGEELDLDWRVFRII